MPDTDVAGTTPSDHSIRAPLAAVLAALDAARASRIEASAPRAAAGPHAAATDVRTRLLAVLRLESACRGDALKSAFAAARDELAARAWPAGAWAREARAGATLGDQLAALMQRANYRELSRDRLMEAFESQALSEVQVSVNMDRIDRLTVFARGRERRTETLRSWLGLRRRTVEFDVLERVFVLCVHRDRADDPRPSLGIKLFRNIPVPDLEVILPNSRVRMRTLDQAVIFVPAVVSVVLAASKVLFSITAIIGLVKFWLGLAADHPVESGGWGLVAAGSFTLLGITMGAWTKYQKRRLQYANAHARTLYFQTLDSEEGAFLRVLDEAYEEEAKEAALAWEFLAHGGPADEATLDARIEAWLAGSMGIRCDFEVDDALAKLERLGVASRAGAKGAAGAGAEGAGAPIWHAVPATEAAERLRAAWDAGLDGGLDAAGRRAPVTASVAAGT
jgi:hypothetical protein